MPLTFTTEKNGVEIRTTLYGPTTPERVERERREATHRCEQFQPVTRKAPVERRVSRITDVLADEAWNNTPYQSTGR